MKCDEFESLHNLYLDSELDAKTTLEVEQHLASCPNCARAFADHQRLEARMAALLKKGQRTTALWERVERSIADPGSTVCRSPIEIASPREPWPGLIATVQRWLQGGLLPSSRAWAGLAAAWAIILILNFVSREPDSRSLADHPTPSTSEMSFAVKQKQRLMVELAVVSEAIDKPKSKRSGPRSDRCHQSRNA